MYEIRFSSAVERYFEKIKEKKLKEAYPNALQKISQNPYIGLRKLGDLNGIYGFDVRYTGVKYEIAYTICEDNNQLVVVILAGTRENFYEELKRYIQ